ncbi:hypothetical protein ABMA28_001237 [Loxostege sticticalis]|uniref:Uncharacterized protein n=1 Tax=Loxostege sticticalis TaxID=481309 RepID=A0ABD0T144_LOXSC
MSIPHAIILISIKRLRHGRRAIGSSSHPATISSSEETVDVIDLGAPRRLRRAPPEPLPGARAARPRASYTPNPRLYPGPAGQSKRRPRRAEGRSGRTRRHVFRRPVPNARLYRPAPRRLPPPASPPRGPWPPPAPPARPLDTASRAALRLLSRRAAPLLAGAPPAPAPTPPAPAPPARSRRLVVTLPAAGAGMDAAARHSTSPDDCSDADALSAPSEFLAEFLSAIMRRQYAEALKYCRLILQYEPHNATARGFYPLLRHKVQALKRNEGAEGAGAGSRRGSSSDSSAYSPAQQSPDARSLSHSHSHSHSRSHSRSHRRVSGSSASPSARSAQSAAGSGVSGGGAGAASWGAGSESEGSVASQSSLELDSTSASGSPSASASAGSSSPAPADANGNPQRPPPPHAHSDDLKNDNDVSHLTSEPSSSLRRLRAQFACSIK